MDALSSPNPPDPSTLRAAAPLRTWLQLLRAPNLFTVPGDPLAGYLLGIEGFSSPIVWLGVLASLCLYSAGLLLNDLADLAEDRRDRPSRPLPSGAAKPAHVWIVAALLSATGLGALAASGSLRALLCGVVLLGAICLYNFLTKHWPVAGAINMGLCRALSVMLGAFLAAHYQLAIIVAVLFGAYIAAVTNLARHETRPRVPVTARLWPGLALLLAGLGGIKYAAASPEKEPAAVVYAAVVIMGGWFAWRLFRRPAPPLPPLIGAHIRLLLPLQAATVWVADPWELGRILGIVLLFLWPTARLVSRWFYAS